MCVHHRRSDSFDLRPLCASHVLVYTVFHELRDTQDRWESNVWQSQGISAEELVKVVKTVFQHTPLREECVERIRSHR